ncbi:hypothetical protein CR513_62419, partial [Mucuna pruriens]
MRQKLKMLKITMFLVHNKKPLVNERRICTQGVEISHLGRSHLRRHPFIDGIIDTPLPTRWKNLTLDKYDDTLTIQKTYLDMLSIHRVTHHSKDICPKDSPHRPKDKFCIHREALRLKDVLSIHRGTQRPKIQSRVHRRTQCPKTFLLLSAMVDEAHDLFNGLKGFAWSPITKIFEAEDEMREELIKRLTSRQVHCAFDIHNDTINFHDTFDESTMNDANIGNFDEIQASLQNVESMSPTFT